MEFKPIETSKNEIKIYMKLVGNFVKKVSQKYNIKEINSNIIINSMNELLSSLYIISDITAISNNTTKREIEKSFYEKNIGWSLNNSYNNIFKILIDLDNEFKNYLLNDMINITQTYSLIKYWNYEQIIAQEEEYKNAIKNKFPKNYFLKLLQSNSDRIETEDYNKILNFVEKFIICRNYRDDYKYFFESYLRNYDEYTSNFIFIYLSKHNVELLDEIKVLFKNVKEKQNKIKILSLLINNNIPNKIYDELKVLQNEIVIEAKTLFNMKYTYRIINDFDINNAIKHYE